MGVASLRLVSRGAPVGLDNHVISTVAFAIGENGGEGRMSGLLFSALALATFARMAMIATGINGEPALKIVLQWRPALCWTAAGAALLYLAMAGVRRLTTKA